MIGSSSSRMLALGVGLAVVGAGIVLVGSASKAVGVVAVRELRRHSTSAYDVLVRPPDAHSAIEERYGLVEPNHLSGIAGGISLQQYEMIKKIPGVEVAAPIAMLGYVTGHVSAFQLATLADPGLYVLEEETIARDGARVYEGPTFTRRTYYYHNPEGSPADLSMMAGGVFVNWSEPVSGSFDFPFLLAGIDPLEEATLIGLDKALLDGRYLSRDEPLNRRANPFQNQAEDPAVLVDLPVLVNQASYVDVTLRAILKRATSDVDDPALLDALVSGDRDYLASLPSVTLIVRETGGDDAYAILIDDLANEWGPRWVGASPLNVPAPIIYEEVDLPVEFDGVTLRVVPAAGPGYRGYLPYRAFVGPTGGTMFEAAFTLTVRGVFDIERIPRQEETTAVPLETYFPPTALLVFDEGTTQLTGPHALLPTLNPAGYIQSPPLMLTTLEAARSLRGDNTVSAIRVRVAGVEEMTSASQRKVEAVASAISQLTGLSVDIMAGSSPTRVLVEVPEIGYVEELWIQKGANLIYQEMIQTGHWVILAILLIVGGLFTMNLAWADVLARERTIGILKALGWRSQVVVREVLRRILVVGGLATVAGLVAGVGLVRVGGWGVLPAGTLAAVAGGVIVACLLGAAYPAWRAAAIPPIVGVQLAGVSFRPRESGRLLQGLWAYALQGLLRRIGETVLACLMAVLSAVLMVIMGGVIVGREGMLGGTLLGEFILIRIGPMHFVIVLAGLVLVGIAAGNSLHARVLEQSRVIGTLRALGWRRRNIVRLFVREGALIGVIGGSLGVLLGLAGYLLLNSALPAGVVLIGILALAVVVLVGALSGLYPGRSAGRVPPAEALRS